MRKKFCLKTVRILPEFLVGTFAVFKKKKKNGWGDESRIRVLAVKAQRLEFNPVCSSIPGAVGQGRQDCWGLLATSLSRFSERLSERNKTENDRAVYRCPLALGRVYAEWVQTTYTYNTNTNRIHTSLESTLPVSRSFPPSSQHVNVNKPIPHTVANFIWQVLSLLWVVIMELGFDDCYGPQSSEQNRHHLHQNSWGYPMSGHQERACWLLMFPRRTSMGSITGSSPRIPAAPPNHLYPVLP